MSRRFLIVGKQFGNLKQAILARGDDFVLLRDIQGSRFTTNAGRRVMCDFSSKESVLRTVATMPQKFDGVLTTYENYVCATSWIAQHLGLPGMTEEAARACTDKGLMRALFAQAPEKVSPDFSVIESLRDAEDFAEAHSFPLIIKPANLAKSLLVLKCHNHKELQENYQRMVSSLDNVYRKYAPNSTPKIILEEFLVGSIHSVDAFIDECGTVKVLVSIVDYQTGYDIGYDDNFHYSRIVPSKLSAAEQAALKRVAAVGCKALDMKSSPAHIEIIMTTEGPRIVEIGARNGGYRERMHKLANDINLLELTLAIKLGESPQIEIKKNEPCAVLELFPKQAGIFAGIANEDQLKQLPSLQYYKIKQPLGNHVGKAGDGYKMCAVIILHNSDYDQFNRDLNYINKSCFVKTS